VPKLACRLGISTPRAHRLLDREGIPPAAGRGHGRRVDAAVAARLACRVGAVPLIPPGFARIDMLVLAAVSRAALGLESARAVARRAGVSPTAASAALRRLVDRGLIIRRPRRLVQGGVRTADLWLADLLGPAWSPEVLAAVKAVHLPAHQRAGPRLAPRVPRRFGHAFWNADLPAIGTDRNADFVASRLLQLDEVEAWLWAACHLPAESLRRAARGRGFDARRRALVENLVAPGPPA